MGKAAALLLVLLLSACSSLAPAVTPAQLDATPGPPVVITSRTYTTTVFTLDFPARWQVITSASFAPVSVVLVRPDQAALMVFSEEEIDVPPLPNPPEGGEVFTLLETIPLDGGVTVYAALHGPSTESDALESLFALAVDSVRGVE
jgi:hypothetical protein